MKKMIVLLLILLGFSSTTAVQAQTRTLADPEALATFLKPRIRTAMYGANIPGAVVVVVKDGHILFSEGFGYANVETETLVEAHTTGFRVASLTKLFTATAVMQLVEQGLVDLHADVNQYLPFTLPATYAEPITLHHLLTHSSGLDDGQTGDAAHTPAAVTPLNEYLANNLPDRIHPPGQLIDYSNHGYALAGYIVEEVSGRPFADYVEAEILDPLQMNHSSLHQPPPAHVAVATGYSFVEDGPPRPEPLDFSNVAPADVLIASGNDMAHFMIALLQTADSPLLTQATLSQMQQTQFSHHPQLRGRTYGFLEWEMNGRSLITHTGGQLGFSSLLTLYPEENMGIFIAQNGRFGNLRFQLFADIMDRYYPLTLADPPATAADFAPPSELSPFAGHYRSVENYFPRTFEKVATIFGAVEEVEIVEADAGHLTIWDNQKLIPQAPQLFKIHGRPTQLYFQIDENNTVTHLFLEDIAYERIHPLESADFHRNLMRTTILILATAVLIIPLLLLGHWWQARRQGESPQGTITYLLAFFISLLAIAFFAALDLNADAISDQIDYGPPSLLLLILTLPIISTTLTIGLVWQTIRAWQHHQGSLLGRTYLSLLSVTAVVFAGILYYWNLLGYKF